MLIIDLVYRVARFAVMATMAGIVGLVLLRGMIGWLKLNPFGWFAFNIRRYSEPLIYPLRRSPLAGSARRDIAPVILVILTIVLGAFSLQILSDVRSAAQGVAFGVDALLMGDLLRGIRFAIGHLVLTAISLLIICIIIQVLFSWLGIHGNRLSRWMYRITEPVLEPLRRTIPPVGMLDLSPLIAYFLLSMIRWAVQVTVLG